MSAQITTFSTFTFSGWNNRFWAFGQMGRWRSRFRRIPGLQFFKMLGNGAGNGFSTTPDFGRYSLFAVWENEKSANDFLTQHPIIKEFVKRSEKHFSVFMHAALYHGSWNGFSNFQPSVEFSPNLPVAVLTRAAIRPKKMVGFWKQVPKVSDNLPDKNDQLLCAYGVGEWPFLQLATFSIWKNGQAMLDYAYGKRTPHADAVRRTREKGWFSEELFARFVPYRMEGTPV